MALRYTTLHRATVRFQELAIDGMALPGRQLVSATSCTLVSWYSTGYQQEGSHLARFSRGVGRDYLTSWT